MKAAGRDTEAAAAGAGCYTAVLCLANRYSADISICRVGAAADFLHYFPFSIVCQQLEQALPYSDM